MIDRYSVYVAGEGRREVVGIWFADLIAFTAVHLFGRKGSEVRPLDEKGFEGQPVRRYGARF